MSSVINGLEFSIFEGPEDFLGDTEVLLIFGNSSLAADTNVVRLNAENFRVLISTHWRNHINYTKQNNFSRLASSAYSLQAIVGWMI